MTKNQAALNVTLEISSGGRSIMTITAENGLYAFAGLCVGEYAVVITPPGSGPILNPNDITRDGASG